MKPDISAVLFSGGLDSAVLLAEQAASHEVQPIYVRAGLAWEPAERAAVEALLAALPSSERVRPLVSLAVDMSDVYAPSHWAMRGRPPGYHTADEEVYLPGRNIVLLAKAAVYCASAGIRRLMLGTLEHNPFPDATDQFRSAMATALSIGLNSPLQVEAPYASVGKTELVRRGVALGVPLGLTLSCMNPVVERGPLPRHCGRCSKCRERHDAFIDAGVDDPTDYADRSYVAAGRSRRGDVTGPARPS